MNIWEILGIEPTRDQGAVRRAYAAAAARYNPEEHPEEFLAVRQAYEQALAFARSAEEPAEVPELPELTMPAQPLPAMEPESRTAGTGGFTLELEPEGSRQPDFPALERFRELYASKQRRDRKQWDLWFTSPEFLAVYRDPAFTAALHQAVEELKEEFPLCKEFQTALAVAYRYRAIVYQDHTEFELEEGAGFEGLQEILQIAVQGPLVRKLQGNDVTLSVAYADYEELMDLARNGVWNSQTLDQLHWILNRYLMAHLREKSTGNIKTERCVISLRILESYFDSQPLPEEVYEVLWRVLSLDSVKMGRAKIFYGRLREIVEQKASAVCEEQERFVELRTAYHDLGSDIPWVGGDDSPRGRELVEQFLAREDFQRAIRSRSFVREEMLPHWCSWYIHPYLIRRLSEIFEADPTLPYAREVVQSVREAERQHELDLQRREEQERLAQRALEEIRPENCALSDPLFLRYFLQTAFYWAEGQGQQNLYGLLEQDFPSNEGWNRRLAQENFTRTIPLTQTITDEQGQTTEQTLEIQIQFHQYYVEYRLNGEELCNPLLPFWGISGIEDDEIFFLLLPVLSAYQDEYQDVTAYLRERLGHLQLPEELPGRIAEALAGEVACLAPTENGTAILRPARFYRETETDCCCCAWYGNGRLLVSRRKGQELVLLQEFCRWDVTSLDQAARIAQDTFDEVFQPARDLEGIGLCRHLYVEYSGLPSEEYEGEAITPELLEQLLEKFEIKTVTRLEVNHELVLLWSKRSFFNREVPGVCALLRFDDASSSWGALLSDWNSYLYAEADTVPQTPFRLGFLPDYAVHQTPKKPIDALVALLHGVKDGNGRWSDKVYLYNQESSYYFAKRALGGFSIERSGGPLLRRKYVIPKIPTRFAWRQSGGPLTVQEMDAAARFALVDQMARFELGALDYLSMTWEFPEEGTVHLVLLHEQDDSGRRDQLVLIRDNAQSIEYLVGNKEEYMEREGKVPKASFGGRMIPRYLLHYDFILIRDFLDLFFLSLPRIDSLVRNNYAAFAYGPKHLTQLGFEEHRRRLLEP